MKKLGQKEGLGDFGKSPIGPGRVELPPPPCQGGILTDRQRAQPFLLRQKMLMKIVHLGYCYNNIPAPGPAGTFCKKVHQNPGGRRIPAIGSGDTATGPIFKVGRITHIRQIVWLAQ